MFCFECCESTSGGCCVFYIGFPVILVFEKAGRTTQKDPKQYKTQSLLPKRPDDDEDEDAEKDSQGHSPAVNIHTAF